MYINKCRNITTIHFDGQMQSISGGEPVLFDRRDGYINAENLNSMQLTSNKMTAENTK